MSKVCSQVCMCICQYVCGRAGRQELCRVCEPECQLAGCEPHSTVPDVCVEWA